MEAQVMNKALQMLTYGVYILGLKDGETYNASTVSWVGQVSFDPHLVMVALRKGTLTQTMVEAAGCFTINLVGEQQAEMAGAFFERADHQQERLNGYAFAPGDHTGAPVLADAPAWLECRVVETIRPGDHVVVIAEVVGAGVRDADTRPLPLRATPWRYGG